MSQINDPGIIQAIKDLTKEIKRQNKILSDIKERLDKPNYIYQPITAPDPILSPPYRFTCDDDVNKVKITCNTGDTEDCTFYGLNSQGESICYRPSSEVSD